MRSGRPTAATWPREEFLRRILVRKNIVEYEIWLFMQREAEEIVQHAERFLAGPHPRVCPATL